VEPQAVHRHAYGSTGGSRALEHLRGIGVELQMVSTRTAVHIGDFFAMFPMGGNEPIQEIEANLLSSAKIALDELVWWAKATMGAKATEARRVMSGVQGRAPQLSIAPEVT